MGLDQPKLSSVLAQTATGSLQLPNFQREWKWDEERIKNLLVTVTLGHPLGVVMTLKTGGEPQFKARPLAGAEPGASKVPDRLLLDGQQRITSLFQAFRKGHPVDTEDGRGNPVKRWFYIDVEAAVLLGVDREDAILILPEERVLRRAGLDLSDEAKEWEAGCFPLNLGLDTRAAFRWEQQYLRVHGEAGLELWPKFDDAVLKRITAFDVPMIELDADTPKDAVCSVFERVNTGGVELDVFELLTATYAGDAAFTAEHSDDFNLAAIWQAVKQRLVETYPVLGSQAPRKATGLTSSDFLQAICLVRSLERKQQGLTASVSCKRRDLLNLPLGDFIRLAPRLEEAFRWVGEFLARRFVFREADLPYRTQLVALAAVRAVLGEQGVSKAADELLTRWYWCGVFGELYGGAIESRIPRDVEQLVAAIDRPHEAAEPGTIAEAVFQERRIDYLTSRVSAAYKGLFALMGCQGVYDWYFTESPLIQETVVGQSVDIRQIFPRPWVSEQTGDGRWADTIVNKTLLSHRANSYLTGLPSNYLPVLAREAGIYDAWLDDRLLSHCIDAELLRADGFNAFYEDRKQRLLALIEQAMGKPVQRSSEG